MKTGRAINRTLSWSHLAPPSRPAVLQRSKSSDSLQLQSTKPVHLAFERSESHAGNPRRTKWIRTCTSFGHWSIVESQLRELKSRLQNRVSASGSVTVLVRKSVEPYCGESTDSNYRLLDDPEISPMIQLALPIIVDLALELPTLQVGPVPALAIDDNAVIRLSRRLCASLLANAVLCTFPSAHRTCASGENYPSINFDELLDTQHSHLANYSMKKEKLKCILNYFVSRQGNRLDDMEYISFARKTIRERMDWTRLSTHLCGMEITEMGSIEESDHFVQVDFANRLIGGGVLRHGCVQEEIRFAVSPELIVARLFTEPLTDNEALEMIGAKNYSTVSGYSHSFRYVKPVEFDE